MRLKKRYIILLTAAVVLLVLAIDFMGINAGFIFLAAGAIIILVAVSSGWVNGILAGIFFNFAFYSLHQEAGLAAIAVNTLVYAAFALLADRISFKPAYDNALDQSKLEEKNFVNKITNSFMLAHDMLLQVKKDINSTELFSSLSANLSNLIGCDQVLIYSPDKAADKNLSLKCSYGKYSDNATEQRVKDDELSPIFLRSTQAGQVKLIQPAGEGFMTAIPVRGDKDLSGAVVLYKKDAFSHSDIYIAEFFAAQVFTIVEKQDMLKQMSDDYENIIEALSMAIDIKDHDTHGHSLSTMKYAVQIAQKMKLPPEECKKIKYAALLHDIGKIKTCNEILKKPSSLTVEEFETIKKHPQDGVNILDAMDIFDDILPIILHHHEHFDGKGYPEKLRGEKIPLGSRICAIADAYSVMLTDRPYRIARSKEEAIIELKRCSGSQFDSHIVNVFLDSMDNINNEDNKDNKEQINRDLVN